MAAPLTGYPFPDFDIEAFSTRSAWSAGPLFIIVWRKDCPTCRMTLPFVERLHKAYKGGRVIGISQDTQEELNKYLEENKLTFRNYADASLRIRRFLSADIVPAYWLIGRDGKTLMSGVGWDTYKIEESAKYFSSQCSTPYAPIVTIADKVPFFKPG